jgi:hypothetical protein
MSHGRAYTLSALAVVTVLAVPAGAQSVISTRSGVVHFFQGIVFLGGQPLEPHLGKFPSMAEGSELRTERGLAEVLLTPGVFLRMGESSAIRLLASDLSDTRVELLAGSALVSSGRPGPGTSVTLIYKDWKVRILQEGAYRINSEPPRLIVRQGEAEVWADATAAPVSVSTGSDLPFAAVLAPEPYVDASPDALANWSFGRSEAISAENAITAQIDQDPTSRNSALGLDGVTYFPLIGIPYIGSGIGSGPYGGYNSYSPYNLYSPYQPGFNSLYSPGYGYRPSYYGLPPGAYPGGHRGYTGAPPLPRVGGYPGPRTFTPAPQAPLPRSAPVRSNPIGGAAHGTHR